MERCTNMSDKLNNLITPEAWEGYSSDQRDWLVFNYLQKIDKRLEYLERRKKIDTGIALAGGTIGGFVAVGSALLARMAGWFK